MQNNYFEIRQKLSRALNNVDEAQLVDTLIELGQQVEKNVLAQRGRLGSRNLTIEETEYYNKLREVKNMTEALPISVIDVVIGEVLTQHPLLSLLNLKKSFAKGMLLIDNSDKIEGEWENVANYEKPAVVATNSDVKVDDPVVTPTNETKVIADVRQLDLYKVTCIAYMSLTILELDDNNILDAYVKELLGEVISLTLEKAIIQGTGVKQPIGMIKQITVADTKVTIKDKTAVAITKLDDSKLFELCGKSVLNTKNNKRVNDTFTLIVNHEDYFPKVATSLATINIQFLEDKNLFPYVFKVITSTEVPKGKAVFGMPHNYVLAVDTNGIQGKLDESDNYKFVEDVRAYRLKLRVNGMATDNKAFTVLDISGLTTGTITA